MIYIMGKTKSRSQDNLQEYPHFEYRQKPGETKTKDLVRQKIISMTMALQ